MAQTNLQRPKLNPALALVLMGLGAGVGLWLVAQTFAKFLW